MAKVITFSRTFPIGHPRKGEPTFFLEKFWASIGMKDEEIISQFIWPSDWFDQEHQPKHHTIRAGNRFKVGDKFSPRVWSGKPYNSKQIIIAPDTEVKKVWTFEIVPALWFDECVFKIDGCQVSSKDDYKKLTSNDGLDQMDFAYWFLGTNMTDSRRKPFDGQIICWNDKIEY